jgi:hypothetical protein
VLCFALALMFVYGVANFAQDWWLEQVVKRGWSSVEIPEVLLPAVTPAWGVIILAAVALHLILMRGLRRGSRHATG